MITMPKRSPRRAQRGSLTAEMLITDFEFTPASMIKEILYRLPGIEHLTVEPGSGRMCVTFRTDELTLADIVDAVGKAGYFTLIGSVSSGVPERTVRLPA